MSLRLAVLGLGLSRSGGAGGASNFFHPLLPFLLPMSASSSPSRSAGELPIIEACLDLIRWFVPLLNRLPRQHKFALGDRLITKQHSGWLGQQLGNAA